MDHIARLKKERDHLEKTYKAGILNEEEYAKSKKRIDEKLKHHVKKVKEEETKKQVISDILNKPKKQREQIDEGKKKEKKHKPSKSEVKEHVLEKPEKKEKVEDIFVDEEPSSNFWSYLFLLIVVVLILFLVYKYTSGLMPITKTITITEFSDFECPYSKQVQETLKYVKEEYKNKVRIIHKHFPAANHKTAFLAGEASECANKQNAFIEYHNFLFENQNTHEREDLIDYAAELELDVDKFTECLDTHEMAQNVMDDIDEGKEKGVSVTPTFFIDDEKLLGVQPLDVFEYIINKHLKER